MYRLMIVEDEPIERETLRMMIQENCDKVSAVEEAENGFEAVRKCRKFLPNIVIVDLNMPGMDGLETIRELQKIDDSIRFLILSAYNRFEFAKEAIKLGVEDFIVKPAKAVELKESVEGVLLKIQHMHSAAEENTALLEKMEGLRPILESDCIHAIVAKKSGEEIKSLLGFLEFQAAYGFCFGVTYENRPRVLLGRIKEVFESVGLACVGEQFHSLLVFFILSQGEIQERRRKEVGNLTRMLLAEERRDKSSVGVGKIYSVEYLQKSYQEVIAVLSGKSGQEGSLNLFHADHEQEETPLVNLNYMAGKILEVLNQKDEHWIKECVSWILTELVIKKESAASSGERIYQLMTVVSAKIQKLFPDIELKSTLSLNTILKPVSYVEAENYCIYYLHNFREAIEGYKRLNHNLIIRRALAYIDHNFEKNISLNDVAEELRISIFYLSKILKKHTGKNFTDILSEKRVDAAKELLRQQLTVKEVTYSVGFNSQNYFAKVFKKYVGCTPREFRNGTGNDS